MNYTPAQKKENVRKIRDYLAENNPPPKFDMTEYVKIGRQIDGLGILRNVTTDLSIYNECGTSACFAGHGPLAGIPGLPDENWECYIDRCLVSRDEDADQDWLFSGDWSEYPEHATAEAAIARADIYLESGIPEGFYGVDIWVER